MSGNLSYAPRRNKDEYNSQNSLIDKNHQASSQKFWQIVNHQLKKKGFKS